MKEVLNSLKSLFVSEKEFLQSSFSFGFNRNIPKTTLVSIVFGLLLALVIYPILAVDYNQAFFGVPYEAWIYIYMFLVPSLMALLVACYIDDTAFVLKVEYILYALTTIGMLVFFTYRFVLLGDEREHVTSTFYIYRGLRPYLDFFEHHHPLLWYSFLPLMWLFHNSEYIWYVARSYTLALIFINMMVVYKIARLIALNRLFSWLAMLLSICSHVVFVAQITFRPDALMSLMLFCGIYYLLKYLKENRNSSIYTAFIFFFLSFGASQKALVFLFFVALLVLYLVFKKEISFVVLLRALIAPVVLFLVYLTYLYQTGALKDYWELNWLLNLKKQHTSFYFIAQTMWFWGANILAIFLLFTKQPLFIRYLSFLCLCFSITLYFIGILVQYWIPLYSLFAIISSYAICRLKDKFATIIFAGVIVSTIFNNVGYIEEGKHTPFLSEFVYLSRIVLENSSPDDLVAGSPVILGGLRLDVKGYYWFGRGYMAVIDNHYFNRHPLQDINEVVKEKKPKIIAITQETGCTREDFTKGPCDQEFVWDIEYLQKHYTSFGPLLIRQDDGAVSGDGEK